MPRESAPEAARAVPVFGGYSGAAPLAGEPERWRRYILGALVETTIARDVLLLTRVDKPALLRRLFQLGSRRESGQATARLVERNLASRRDPQHGFRADLGLMSLGQRYEDGVPLCPGRIRYALAGCHAGADDGAPHPTCRGGSQQCRRSVRSPALWPM